MKTCYISFHSVSDSLKFEKAIKNENLDIKLVPVPREVSSSCGVAAMFSPEIREEVDAFLERTCCEIEAIHLLERDTTRKSLLERLKEGK